MNRRGLYGDSFICGTPFDRAPERHTGAGSSPDLRIHLYAYPGKTSIPHEYAASCHGGRAGSPARVITSLPTRSTARPAFASNPLWAALMSVQTRVVAHRHTAPPGDPTTPSCRRRHLRTAEAIRSVSLCNGRRGQLSTPTWNAPTDRVAAVRRPVQNYLIRDNCPNPRLWVRVVYIPHLPGRTVCL